MASLTVTIDCADPISLSMFWRELLGYHQVGAVAQYASIRPDDGGVDGPKMIFQRVPEGKVSKNRLHLDLDLDRGTSLEDEVARAVGLGATPSGDVVAEFGLRWQVMTDPEGNEFCIVAPDEAEPA